MTTALARTSAAPRKRGSADRRKKSLAAYAMIAPFILVFVAMLLIPLIYAGYLSLFKVQLVGGEAFVGLDNYLRALQDQKFIGGVLRMCLFLVIQVPIMLGLALVFALALDSARVRGGKFARLAIFVPYAVPGVVATLMWGYLYGKNFGPIAQVFESVGLAAPDLLGPQNILGSIMNIVTWQFVGYNMVIMYSALRAIPTEQYEAARIDGAGQFRIAWSIKIPSIRSAIILTLIFSIIGSFQLFSEPKLLYEIAPAAIGTDFSPNLYAYNLAFINQDVNYAAAIAFLLGFCIMIVSYVVQLSTARREKRERKAR
ncbi:sugar ABC transporter permease [Herbiconiux moechotypicola]|uniref:Sugar ABC transporter permease n=1 Tax=Herbiconiux moechotypicola TaxID=637393 RepID=A0ABN3DC34_9MICO|nr:sugar ABC transporter permease [Herbiconiux moechotypicola]MCS5728825.1 sugar ABC transporter permease [Herbiconiux moechotypicola]